MAVTAKAYGLMVRDVFNGAIVVDWNTDTIKVALTTVTYSPDQDVHDRFDDVTNEVVGAGYTAGGVTLTAGNQTITYTAGTNTVTLDGEDASWAASTITARTAVVYKSTGVASTSPLICYQQSDADISSTAGTFSVVWNASGIVTFVAA
jgi:hypothetical protein